MANTYEMRVRPKDNVFEYVSWSGWLPASKNNATKRIWNWMAGSYLSSDMGMRLLYVIAKNLDARDLWDMLDAHIPLTRVPCLAP